MHHAAQQLADLVAEASSTATCRPSSLGPARQDLLSTVLLARLQPDLAAALERTNHLAELDELMPRAG
jgi:hypothetical protein